MKIIAKRMPKPHKTAAFGDFSCVEKEGKLITTNHD